MIGSGLFDGDFGAEDALASEGANFALRIVDDAVFSCMDCVVAGYFSTFAAALGHTDLADDDLADSDFFAAKELDAKALAGVVMVVLACSTSFDV